MAKSDVPVSDLNSDLSVAVTRSVWALRVCQFFFACIAGLCAVLFIFQAFFHRNDFGELFLFQRGAWSHLSGHLVRGLVAALLTQRLVLVQRSLIVLKTQESTTAPEDSASRLLEVVRVLGLWWRSLAYGFIVLLCYVLSTYAVLFLPEWPSTYSRRFEAATDFSTPVTLAIHLAQDRPQKTWIQKKLSETGELLYVNPAPFITNADVANAVAVNEQDGNPVIRMRFVTESIPKIRKQTQIWRGLRVAIMIDGELFLAPVLSYPFSEGADFTGSFSLEEAQRIARGIMSSEAH